MSRIILIVGIALGFLFMVFDFYVSYAFLKNLSRSIETKNEKLEEMANFQEYLSMLKDAETGQRGYIITGNPIYLEPYEKALSFIHSKQTEALLNKTEEKEIGDDVKYLKILTHHKLNELQSVIDKYTSSGFVAAKSEVSTQLGKNEMDKIRDLIDHILSTKHKVFDKYEKENNDYISFILDLIISINIFYLIATMICLYILYFNIGREKES